MVSSETSGCVTRQFVFSRQREKTILPVATFLVCPSLSSRAPVALVRRERPLFIINRLSESR
jgi:hypothetical protein